MIIWGSFDFSDKMLSNLDELVVYIWSLLAQRKDVIRAFVKVTKEAIQIGVHGVVCCVVESAFALLLVELCER